MRKVNCASIHLILILQLVTIGRTTEDRRDNFYIPIQQKEGGDLKLRCKHKDLDSNMLKKYHVRWYFKPCSDDWNRWLQLPCNLNNNCQLNLKIENSTKNNTGLYKCTIHESSTIEIQVQMFHVNVTKFTHLDSEYIQLPIFLENLPTNFTAELGSKVSLQCRVYSQLHTTIKWFRNIQENNFNSNQRASSGEYSGTSDILEYFNKTYKRVESAKEKILAPNIYLSKLIIRNVTEKDTGKYTCVAVNLQGHSVTETFFQIKNDDIEKEMNLLNFSFLFLIPLGLALSPLPLWLVLILSKRRNNRRLRNCDCEENMQ